MKNLLKIIFFISLLLLIVPSTMQAIEKGPGWTDTILDLVQADTIFDSINAGFAKAEYCLTEKAKNWKTNNPKTISLLKNNFILIVCSTTIAANIAVHCPIGEYFLSPGMQIITLFACGTCIQSFLKEIKKLLGKISKKTRYVKN